ncbi:hypothetical protein WAB17_00195 [Parerythrobacter aurantius]|uniref:hypothetical protein n=1 Tax=Parerythrobacter aurantius TaxID=3127706 RepID=UPI00325408D2
MTWPTAVVIIVMVVCAAKVLNARYRARNGIIEDMHGNQSFGQQASAEKDRELAELRERVKVLEAIATDPARRTAEEIERLRDER